MDNRERFESALYGVSDRLRPILFRLPESVKERTQEIRMRAGLPLALTVKGKPLFVLPGGQTSLTVVRDLVKTESRDLEESLRRLCRSSVYAHAEELKNGFIIMQNGHRAGIFGTRTENGALRDISSVSIRIAREIFGAADSVVRQYRGEGLLIAGPPGSGKTTVLRDLIRQLSNGATGRFYRVAVIDSRGELSGSSNGMAGNDLGVGSDILLTPRKADGIEIAVRTMFPDIVAFDEIGTAEELNGVAESFFSGVSVITTAHIGNRAELLRRSVTRRLLQSRAIGQVAILSGVQNEPIRLFSAEELCHAAVS